MKHLKKAKLLVKLVILGAVLMALILPGAAITPKTPLNKIVSHEGKNLHLSSEWIEQATAFSAPSRGINYVSVVNENIAWAAAYDGTNPTAACQEFTRTVDGGTTWLPGSIPGTDGLSLAMIFAIDGNTSWTPMYKTGSSGTQGIYKTTDGGLTWVRQTTADYNGNGAFPNCVHFWDQNIGWCMGDPVGGYYEIYTTTNGGTTWTRIPQADIPAPLSGEFGVVGYYCTVNDTIWFGTNMGRVYKSIDKGFHWTVAQTSLSEYIKPTFKDANNGLVIDLNAESNAMLSETSDGGTTWQSVEYSGICYDTDLLYIPGTPNMYISTGAAEGFSGGSYSVDGGHSWTEYEDMIGIQMMNLGFTEDKVGWAGAFNTDETTGGIFKHIYVGGPLFSIDILGGRGITVKVTNVGEEDATNVNLKITIEGGFWIKQREFTGTVASLPVEVNSTFPFDIMGIGLGILKTMPKITATVTCAQNVTATKSINAKILFSTVTPV